MLVFTNAEVRSWVLQLTDQWLQLTYSQVFIAVIVAILGIVNTLTVSIIDRKRELGVLRAVGGFRRQIRQTVWMEAVAIGLVGLGAWFVVWRGKSVFPVADYGSRLVGHASAVQISVQHRRDAASDDSRRGVFLGAVAGRIRRAHVARRGTGI